MYLCDDVVPFLSPSLTHSLFHPCPLGFLQVLQKIHFLCQLPIAWHWNWRLNTGQTVNGFRSSSLTPSSPIFQFLKKIFLIINRECSPDETEHHLGHNPLPGTVQIFLEGLNWGEKKKDIASGAPEFHSQWKGEHLLPSLLPDCRCDVIFHPTFLMPFFPTTVDWILTLWTRTNPSFSKLL